MRRRLLDVGKKVSGALAGPRADAADDTEPAAPGDSPGGGAPRASAGAAPPDTGQEATIPTTEQVVSAPAAAPAGTEPEDPAVKALSPGTPDPVAAAAVELARQAAVEEAGPRVGDHLGAEAEMAAPEGEQDHVVTHSFASTDPAYVGWRWAVTVARAPGSEHVTVDEVVLLPGSRALLAPAWVPWSDRIRPGDLSPGDLLPPESDDPRLVPSYADVDADRLPFDLHRELGLGRPRVLSREGRLDAAERWYDGPAGPASPLAKAAPASCASCGFLVPLAGGLGTVFGACANEVASDDGRVVALTHGCGAHSETVLDTPLSTYAGMVVEDDEFELVDSGGAEADAAAGPASDEAPAAR